MSEQVVLKSCPFCSGTANAEEVFPHLWDGWAIVVDHTADCPIRSWDGFCYPTRAEAALAWNTRATMPTEGQG